MKCPELLDQAIIEFACPSSPDELNDLVAPLEEFGAIPPTAIHGVDLRTRSGSRVFQVSSAMRTFCAADSRENGGKSGHAIGEIPYQVKRHEIRD